MADDLSGYVELLAARTERESEVVGGLRSDSETDAFIQTYNLNFERALYPNLRFLAGGLFRLADSTFTTLAPFANETETVASTRRPFVKFLLSSDLVRGQLSYTRVDERTELDGRSAPRNVRETYSGYLGWFPDRAPSAQLRLFRTDTHDGGREFIDVTEDRVELTSQYTAIEPLNIRYRGNRTETEDRLNGNESRTDSHNARIIYTDSFWNDRFSLTSDYNASVRETETITRGAGEVDVVIFPFAGLSAIDDTPDTGPLLPNSALIDGAVAAGAGINLGLPPVGGNDEARNVGLDFGVETRLNTLFVWVDRELPAGISGSFSWDVYASTDNLNWVLRESIGSATFGGPFLPRFELRFADVTARYVKVVADPLSPTVPMASSYPLILVTELQPFLRVPAAEIERKRRRTTQIYNLNSRLRMLESPLLHYEFDAFFTDTDSSETTYLFTNGVSLSHSFNEIYSVGARARLESERDPSFDRDSWIYSASFSAVPVPKWRNRLVASGRNDDSDLQGKEDRGSLLLNSILALYRGVDVNLGLGRTFRSIDGGPKRYSTLYNAILQLSPHRTLNVNLIHRESSADAPFGPEVSIGRDDSLSEANAAYTPVETVYLFASYRRTRRTDQAERITRNYALNWTPFPHGALRFNLNYNETYRSEDGSTTSTLAPNVRWSIRSNSFLDVAYQRLRSELPLGRTSTNGLFVTLRLAF